MYPLATDPTTALRLSHQRSREAQRRAAESRLAKNLTAQRAVTPRTESVSMPRLQPRSPRPSSGSAALPTWRLNWRPGSGTDRTALKHRSDARRREVNPMQTLRSSLTRTVLALGGFAYLLLELAPRVRF